VLLVLKTQGLANDTRGLYDLRDVQVKKVDNYWLKIAGVSCNASSRRARGDAVWRWSVTPARAASRLHGSLLRPDYAAADAASVQRRYSMGFR
jgi:hypothetical protein